ncbi:MAG: Omp28-related outer membrane protein [Bacteroidetes bacterium]|nr:Omp28-related outer membrane protein [Bacteroidota bacterium]
MKQFVTTSLALTITSLFYSCKEKGPMINLATQETIIDTTYLATKELQRPRHILIEDFTGAQCTNCPAATKLLVNISNNNPDRLHIIAHHTYNTAILYAPAVGHKYDLRTQKGTDLAKMFYPGLGNLPAAGIDRAMNNGSILQNDYTQWANFINSRLNVNSPANMKIESSYDEATHSATIQVIIAYTTDIAAKQYLSVAITEDSITDVQDFPFQAVDTAYTFRHTLRDYLTPLSGSEILDKYTTKEAGRVYIRTLKYTINSVWKPEQCHIVAFLHNNNGNDKMILQSAESKLK